MKNATIRTTLENLLNVMDARANVSIFVGSEESNTSVKYLKVYNFLSESELMSKYGSRKVIGLSVTCGVTSILIEEV